MRAAWLVVWSLAACGGAQKRSLAAAGADEDEGAGDLSRASLRLETGDDSEPRGFDDTPLPPAYAYNDGYGGDMYGGDPYGGDVYGGTGYANWRPPQWNYQGSMRVPRYQAAVDLRGSIEGTVSWGGAMPSKLTAPCGVIDNPTLRVSSDKHVRGTVVYIDNIERGRMTPFYTRPASVGGIVAKHGCALLPAVQIVTPLPGGVQIHGDATPAKLRITPVTGPAHVEELQEGGVMHSEIVRGVTRIDSEDGKTGAAWVLGLDTPYVAITDDAGRYRIDELPPGSYQVTFWQPPVASIVNGQWTYGQPIVMKRSVQVGGKTTQLSVTLR